MASEIDYATIDPSKKWKILRERWPYLLWALWTSLGSMMLGWDYVAGGQLASLPDFRKQFGVLQDDGTWLLPARYLSAWQSIGPACEVVSAIIAAPFLEKYGRKPQIFVSSLISVVGVLLQQLAKEWTVHLAGRAVNGVAIGVMFTISPLWIGETCRPELRGFFLCLFNTSIVLGQFLIVVVGYAASFVDEGKWQWWTVVLSMYIFPALLISAYPWFPESPYWLIREGKLEKATDALQRMYGGADAAFLDIELQRLQEDVQLNQQVQDESNHSTRRVFGIEVGQELECFRGTNLKRTLTSMFAASAQQLIGAVFAVSYATYFFELIGIKEFFLTSCMLYVVMLLSTCAAFPLVEIVGRRTLLVPSLFVLSGILLIMGILGFFQESQGALWGIVVLMYVWALVYQLSVGATGFVLASEVATMRLRGATQALVTTMNGVWGLIMQFTVPYMINTDAGNLGGKTGFIFFGTGILTAIGAFFLFPETKGLSFQQLDELYASKVAPRNFKKRAVVFACEDGASIGKENTRPSEHQVEISTF